MCVSVLADSVGPFLKHSMNTAVRWSLIHPSSHDSTLCSADEIILQGATTQETYACTFTPYPMLVVCMVSRLLQSCQFLIHVSGFVLVRTVNTAFQVKTQHLIGIDC